MSFASSIAYGVRTLARREFWTFKVVHAMIGGLLTVAGAAGGILFIDQIRKEILAVDGQIADNSHRVESIERALTQFQMLQSEGFLLNALASGEAMRTELRKSFLGLGFMIRKGAMTRLITELHPDNLDDLLAKRKEQDRLFEAAMAAGDLSAWDNVLRFEMENEARLRDVLAGAQDARVSLRAQRRALESRLATATNWTFIIQQAGFFIVLLAGLIHQYEPPREGARTADPPAAVG